jgi:hypothetical protein
MRYLPVWKTRHSYGAAPQARRYLLSRFLLGRCLCRFLCHDTPLCRCLCLRQRRSVRRLGAQSTFSNRSPDCIVSRQTEPFNYLITPQLRILPRVAGIQHYFFLLQRSAVPEVRLSIQMAAFRFPFFDAKSTNSTRRVRWHGLTHGDSFLFEASHVGHCRACCLANKSPAEVAGQVDLCDCFDAIGHMRNAGPAARPRQADERRMVRSESSQEQLRMLERLCVDFSGDDLGDHRIGPPRLKATGSLKVQYICDAKAATNAARLSSSSFGCKGRNK